MLDVGGRVMAILHFVYGFQAAGYPAVLYYWQVSYSSLLFGYYLQISESSVFSGSSSVNDLTECSMPGAELWPFCILFMASKLQGTLRFCIIVRFPTVL